MFRAALLLALTAAAASAWFVPKMNMGKEGDSNNIDSAYTRDAGKEIVVDSKHNKFYSDTAPSEKMNYFDAQKHCADMQLAGYTDWQVPSKKELRSLLENSRSGVAIKHAFKNVLEDIYWSSTPDRYDEAWYFDFDLGRYGTREYERLYRVFCVRDSSVKQ